MNIILVGADGKMGRIVSHIAQEKNIKIIAKIDKNYKKYTNFDKIPQNIIKKADLVLDFAMPEVLDKEIEFCLKHNIKMVICSTGHSKKQEQKILFASKKIAIFKTSNTSIGVALINKILNDNSKILKEYNISIIDKHHKNKKDSPSGTADNFLKTLNINNIDAKCMSIRSGTCIGEHNILMYGDYEQICLSHIAESRTLFALGALKICEYVQSLNSGFYNMENFLKEKLKL